MEQITIGQLTIASGATSLVIAEVGINHNGDMATAKKMIVSAAENGADLIKLQSFQPEKFLASSLPYYPQIEKLALGFDMQRELFRFAQSIGVNLFSAAFDTESADFLDSLGMHAFKIASMDCNNVQLLRHTAKKQKPIFLATGMADMEEVELAVRTIRKEGNNRIVLMHCVSDYPAAPAGMNLKAIATLSEKFGLHCGLSDHSFGLHAAFAAASMGAVAIEKHFTPSREMAKEFPFSDHAISIEPAELKELSAFCKSLPAMSGDGIKRLSENERENRDKFRRGIYAARDLEKGIVLSEGDCIALRPVHGISVARWDEVIGKKVKKSMGKWEPVELSALE